MEEGTNIEMIVMAVPETSGTSKPVNNTDTEPSEPGDASQSKPIDTAQSSDASEPLSDSDSVTDNYEDAVDEENLKLRAQQAFTGFFRDGARRIDLVLVMQDTENSKIEEIQRNFIMSALEIGLEVELEPGVETMHKSLIFVKVHAPDDIINESGLHYNIRKFFKDSHVELVNNERKFYTLFLPCPGIKMERQLIKIVRNQYPGPGNYSPLERSNIVYRLLLSVSFGRAENHVGLQRLLENNIVLDAYPLHDGPYYFLPEQDKSEPNGRQVLFHQWAGFSNLLKSEPVHMIREYFGERIGFFFSFYDFYTRALFVAGVIGLLTFIAGFGDKSDDVINHSACTPYPFAFSKWYATYVGLTRIAYWYASSSYSRYYDNYYERYYNYYEWNTEKILWYTQNKYKFSMSYTYTYPEIVYRERFLNYKDLPVCPKCRDFFACPFRNTTDYCTEVKLKNLIDNPYAICYSLFIYIWALLVVLIWRRKENCLSWIWEEVDDSSLNAIRPQYRVSHTSYEFGILDIPKKLFHLFIYVVRIAVVIGFLILYFFVAVPVLIVFKYRMLEKTRVFEKNWHFMTRTYVVFLLFAMINAFLIMIMEKVCKIISYYLVHFMNFRTEDTYERALVVKWFGFSFINNFTIIFFIAFAKGAMYTFPGDLKNWYKPYGFGMMNCGLLSCIDELWIVYVVTMVAKRTFQGFLNMFGTSTTDYNRGRSVNQNVPCWEKEYSLIPLNDDFIMQKYKDLIMQFAVSTMFVTVFPLAPLVAFVINLWEMRSCAQLLIQRCRRPLIIKSCGLGAWMLILQLLPFVIAVCNALNVTLNYNLIDKYVHQRYFNDTRFFQDYYTGFYNTTDFSDYGNMSRADDPAHKFVHYWFYFPRSSDFCLFPGKYRRQIQNYKLKHVYPNSYTVMPNKYLVHWHQVLFFIVYQKIAVLLAALLYYFIRANPSNIEETRAVEETVRHYARRREGDKKLN